MLDTIVTASRIPSEGGNRLTRGVSLDGINVKTLEPVRVEGKALTYSIGKKKILDNVSVRLNPVCLVCC
jgi:hypothetical protein